MKATPTATGIFNITEYGRTTAVGNINDIADLANMAPSAGIQGTLCFE